MLVLTRKVGETIDIGNGLAYVHVLHIDHRKKIVRLGIDAPQEIKIMRTELIDLEDDDGNAVNVRIE